uniref:NADH-ubiquinone oxidoreductase chain 2 n=1 Tax=Franklinothrips vespiformis TaxID=297892 RepID=A0A8A5L9I7_FRAVS|nr:NADH dehydrogenase subunit 2 [Franklinothrips vespiformis]
MYWKEVNKMLFMTCLILSIYLSLNMSSFFGLWMSMELNLMCFLPILISSKSMLEGEIMSKYFLIQFLGSFMFLYMIILIDHLKDYESYLNLILILSICLKMGASPFHFWIPSIFKGLSWTKIFILSVFQKMIPLIVLVEMKLDIMILLMISFLSIFMGSLGGLNQFCIRKLMGFSSISHLGWMLLLMKFSTYMLLIYFLFYSILNLEICYFFMKENFSYLSDLLQFKSNKLFSTLFCFNFLSLGGLPPFFGFFPKAFSLAYLIQNNLNMFAFLILILSMISLYFYLRLTLKNISLTKKTGKLFKNFSFTKDFTVLFLLKVTSYFISFLIFLVALIN